MGTAIDVLKSSELENLAAATANALSGVTADREVLRSSVFDYDQRKVGSSYYVGYYDFVEMMENLLWMKLSWMNGSKHMMQLLSVGKNANDFRCLLVCSP